MNVIHLYTTSTFLTLTFKGPITILIVVSPLVGIIFLAIHFAYDFASKIHIKEKASITQ